MLNTFKQRPSNLKRMVQASLVLALSAVASAAAAQGRGPMNFTEQTGESIYKNVCQGCHMPDAKGASGAGAYPALAGDKKLAAKLYPVLVLVRGQKAMPEFGSSMSDMQIAEVVNYIRTHFGNSYSDPVTPDDVKKIRPAMK